MRTVNLRRSCASLKSIPLYVYVIKNATRFKYILSFYRLMLGMQLLFGRVRPCFDITYAKYGRGKLASIYRAIQLTFYVLIPADECNLNSMFQCFCSKQSMRRTLTTQWSLSRGSCYTAIFWFGCGKHLF